MHSSDDHTGQQLSLCPDCNLTSPISNKNCNYCHEPFPKGHRKLTLREKVDEKDIRKKIIDAETGKERMGTMREWSANEVALVLKYG